MTKKDAFELAKDAAEELVETPEQVISDDFYGHIASEDCWCSPKAVYVSPQGNIVYEHFKKQ